MHQFLRPPAPIQAGRTTAGEGTPATTVSASSTPQDRPSWAPAGRAPGDARTGDLVNLGVEEEFHVVDLHTRELVPRAGELLDRLPADSFTAELHRSVVETNTAVCRTLDEIRAELTAAAPAGRPGRRPGRAGHRGGRYGAAARRRRPERHPHLPLPSGCSTSTSCSPASS